MIEEKIELFSRCSKKEKKSKGKIHNIKQWLIKRKEQMNTIIYLNVLNHSLLLTYYKDF